MREKKNNRCYYCGNPSTSKEHLPPKCIFPDPRPSTLITVPSCNLHNSKQSKDDEYFRWVITTASAESEVAENLIMKKVIPQFKRKPKLLHDIFSNKRSIPLYTKIGIFAGYSPGFEIDSHRFQKSINKITRGLFFYHQKEILKKNFKVEKFILNPKLDKETQYAISLIPLNIVMDHVFSYRFFIENNDNPISYWFYMFYDNTLIMTVVSK